LIEASPLTLRTLAKQAGTLHSALIRMMNPFYWGHWLTSPRQLGEALEQESALSSRPVPVLASSVA